jgi:outer membrane protein TolC
VCIAGLAVAAACASYEARPLDEHRARERFEARTLSDPELATFARERLGEGAVFPPERFDLATLALVALFEQPDIAVARAESGIARAKIRTAEQRPNPTLAFDPEYVSNGPRGSEPWIFGLHLDVPIESGEKRDVRIEAAEREAVLAELHVHEIGWRVRSDVRRAFVEHAFARRELELATGEAQLRAELVEILRQRFEAGEVARVALVGAEIESSRAQLTLAQLEGREHLGLASLASSLAVPASALGSLELDDGALNTPAATPEVGAARDLALLGRLDVRRARIEYALSELGLRAQVAAQYPDVHIAPGYTWDQGDHKFAFGASFEVPLFNDHSGQISEATAARETARERFEAVQTHVLAALDEALARHAAASAELARSSELAQRGRARLDAEQQSFDAGASDRFDLADARLQSALLEHARLDALRRVQDAQTELEDVLQRPLDGGAEVKP